MHDYVSVEDVDSNLFAGKTMYQIIFQCYGSHTTFDSVMKLLTDYEHSDDCIYKFKQDHLHHTIDLTFITDKDIEAVRNIFSQIPKIKLAFCFASPEPIPKMEYGLAYDWVAKHCKDMKALQFNNQGESNTAVGTPEAKQPTLAEVIPYLELWQQDTSDDVAMYCKALERPEDNDPIFQSHTKQVLADALHQRNCLNVVITKLKEELECEVFEYDPEAKKKGHTAEEMDAESQALLAAIRKRRAEQKEAE